MRAVADRRVDGQPQGAVGLSVLVLVVALGTFLRLYFMDGPVGTDDTNYATAAEWILGLQPFTQLNQQAGRLGYLLVAGLPVHIGQHIVFGSIANIVCAALADILVVRYCWQLFGLRPALAAALTLALSPILVVFTGMMLPEPLLVLLMLIAVMAFERVRGTDDGRSRRYGVFGVGVLTGLAYLAKEPALFLLPVFGVFLLAGDRGLPLGKRALAPTLLVGGFALIFVIDGAIYLAYTGDFLYRIHANLLVHNAMMGAVPLSEAFSFVSGRTVGVVRDSTYFVALAIGVPGLLLCGLVEARSRVFAAVGVTMAMFQLFGSTSVWLWQPLPVHPRYFIPVVPFVAIALASLFSRISRPERWKRDVVILGVFALVSLRTAFPAIAEIPGTAYHAAYFRNVATAVEILAAERKPLFVEPSIKPHLQHFVDRQRFSFVETIDPAKPLGCGYYVVLPVTLSLPQRTFLEITRMPVKMVVDLDWRISNRFRLRQLPEARRRPATVYERACGPGDAHDQASNHKSGKPANQVGTDFNK